VSASPKRVAVSLTDRERDELQQLAQQAGEPTATTAGRLLRAALTDHGAKLDAPPAGRTGPPRRRTTRRPAATDLGDAIEALRARYPVELRHLPAPLDADAFLAEQTAALITWRTLLDAAGEEADPRDELRFGYELRTFAIYLQERARRAR